MPGSELIITRIWNQVAAFRPPEGFTFPKSGGVAELKCYDGSTAVVRYPRAELVKSCVWPLEVEVQEGDAEIAARPIYDIRAQHNSGVLGQEPLRFDPSSFTRIVLLGHESIYNPLLRVSGLYRWFMEKESSPGNQLPKIARDYLGSLLVACGYDPR